MTSPDLALPVPGDPAGAPGRDLIGPTGPVRRLRQVLRDRRRARVAGGRAAGRRMVLLLLASVLALFAALGWALAYLSPDTPGRHVGLGDVETLAAQHRVTGATLLDEDSRIVARVSPDPTASLLPQGGRVWTAYPSTGALTARLEATLRDGGAAVDVDPQPARARVRFVAQFVLPVLLLADLFALLIATSRGRNSAIGDVVDFGSLAGSRAGATPVRFTDVGGADEAVAELAEVRDYLLDPERYRRLGAAPPKGVLLFGPPGTGKTLLAKAVAGEAGVPFFSVAGAQFVESLVGVGAARVRDLFGRVRAVAPAIVFIDELDAVGRRRGIGGGTGGSDEREQTLNQLLVEMDGFDVASGIVVIAATNRPDILDPALMRPGRFDRHVTIERPDVDGRLKILEIHGRGKPLATDVDLADIAHRTPGFTGADLANVVNEAALLTVRAGDAVVTQARLSEAIDRVLSGPRRRGRLVSETELRRTAVHEVGHAVVAAATGRAADVHRVSVLPRGRTLGTTTVAAEEEASQSSTSLRARLAVLVAGVAAERLRLGDVSTAGEHDLEEATALARDMVTRYGMSERLGLARLAAGSTSGFLGETPPLDAVSQATHEAVDAEVRALLESAEAEARAALATNASLLDTLVQRLVVDETLEGAALAGVLAGVVPAGSTTTRRVRRSAATAR